MNHKITLTRSVDATIPAFNRHVQLLTDFCDTILAIDLVSQKDGSGERILSDAYSDIVGSSTMDYVPFDFHAYCRGGNYDALNVLLDTIRDRLVDYGWYLCVDGHVILEQQGIVRMNCIDCLDRTNVTMTFICRFILDYFITNYASVLSLPPHILLSTLSPILTSMWHENGDALSLIYTGTPALKSELITGGKRTWGGMFDDAQNSVSRFVMNNFTDKSKEELLSLFGASVDVQHPSMEHARLVLQQQNGVYTTRKSVYIHIGTFNVNAHSLRFNTAGRPVYDDGDLSMWLTANRVDALPCLIVLGFQELVPLTPTQMMVTDTSVLKNWETHLLSLLPEYVAIRSSQLVGAALLLFATKDTAPHIRYVYASSKKTGLSGLAGNKGGISISLALYDTSLCFTTAHLAAGQSNVVDRNGDYHTIMNGIRLNNKSIKEHSFWFGDFNYRVDDWNVEKVRQVCSSGNVDSLLAHDQLIQQMKGERVFVGYREAPITFMPTYKYDVGTNNYDTSEKERIPSWTDRIVWCGEGVECVAYGREESVLSDHKPVKGTFRVCVDVVDKVEKEKVWERIVKGGFGGGGVDVQGGVNGGGEVELIDFGVQGENPFKSVDPFKSVVENPFESLEERMEKRRGPELPSRPEKGASVDELDEIFGKL